MGELSMQMVSKIGYYEDLAFLGIQVKKSQQTSPVIKTNTFGYSGP